MNDRETQKRLDEAKYRYRDDAIIQREREAAIAGLSFSTFVTAIGPLGVLLLKAVNAIPVGVVTAYLIYATAPIGLFLTAVNYFRTPKDYRGNKLILRPVLIAVVAAVTMFVLAGYWGFRKVPVVEVESP